VRQFLADTLRRSPADCDELAKLMLAKTGGNPFFVNQFLHTLHQNRLLVFDRAARGWRWNMAFIEALGVTDNIVDFVLERVRKLPEHTRRTLKLAACAGASFDIETLVVLCEDEPAALQSHLVPAVEMGLILPLSASQPRPGGDGAAPRIASYAFAHDRVQQAAYSLIPQEARAATHLRIARLLERALAADEHERHIFEIAEHFDLGARLIEDADERIAVARLEFAAGRRAHLSLAHDTALRFLRAGLALLPAERWSSCYELTRDLTRAAMEAEQGNADFDAAWRLSQDLLTNAGDALDQATVYEFRLSVHIARNQPNEALELALEALHLLGISLPREPAAIQSQVEALREQLRLDAAGFTALEQLPALVESHQTAAIQILSHASTVAFLIRPQLWELIVMTTVSVCMRHGHSPLAALAYAWYGVLLCGREQELDLGCRFGDLAVRLLERFPGANVTARIGTLFNVFVLPWHRPIREAIDSLRAVAQCGLQNVDPEHALYAAINCTITRFFAGDPLADVHREQFTYLQIIDRHRLLFHRTFLSLWERTCYRLLGHAAQASDCQPDDATLALWQAENQVLLLLCAYCCRAMERYIDGDYDAALQAAEQGCAMPQVELAPCLWWSTWSSTPWRSWPVCRMPVSAPRRCWPM
jgi:predicted ATPase